ncbi:MAG: Holliday junction branch migration protein RuvA [Gammaproteobacteria bacterium]|nr:Holliday junction branch migration protein RuvA [Gammaproteobacteria bacterium]
MFSYLIGKVTTIEKDSIELEVNNMGYKIYTPNPYSFKIDEELKVYTYLYIKDENLTLYGFRENEEKSMFLKLISVSGIGPKSANAIIASGSVTNIAQAINRGDAKYLTKFPGIGMKSAQQIILDLKGKVEVKEYSGNYLVLDEVHDALLALGYSEKDITKVLPKLDSTKPTNQLIRDALAIITR